MGTISNSNVGPAGQVISTTTVNAKFTDVATATGTIDANNVRSEGVDRRTLAASRTEPIVKFDYDDNGTGPAVTYTGQTGRVPFEVLILILDWTAAPVVMKAGDLLRINFTVRLDTHNDPNYLANFVTADSSDSVGVIFYPVWDIGSGWAVLPNQATINSTYVGGTPYIPINSTDKRTDSVAWCSMEGIHGTPIQTDRTIHGSCYILHSGGDETIEKIRINGRGPVAFHQRGGAASIEMNDWTIDPYAVPFGFNAAQPMTFTVGYGQLSAIIMRGDS